jgi:putative transposase
LRDRAERLIQELLNPEILEFVGAEPYERSEEQQGHRNGYRQRELFTQVGHLILHVPRDREGRFSTLLFENYQRSEKALVLALQESYLQGVSTHKVKRITEKLCGVEFSKDQVSRMAQALDEGLNQWRSRPLNKSYPYLVADARYEHVREDGRVESQGVLTVKGIDEEGYREILSVAVAPGGEEESWCEVFADLLDRGLDPKSVGYVVSDQHRGLRAALRRYLPVY